MTFWLFALTITLSVFAVVSLAASGIAMLAASAVARRVEAYAPDVRAGVLFRFRLAPVAAAVVVALGIALPIYLAYEPRETTESLARTLIVTGLAGAALVSRGAWRAAAAWRATSDVRRDWESRGRRIARPETDLPVFAIDEPFPIVAVIGLRRPALFISDVVLREFTNDEVSAMLRHESAHITMRDNLKRFVIRACPDAVRRGSLIDRVWANAAEEAADAAAVRDAGASACDLAGALIRVARLAPARAPHLASAFYLGGSIEARVRRLMSPHAPEAPTPFGCVMLLTGTLCFAAAVVFAAPILHQVMETLVSRLP